MAHCSEAFGQGVPLDRLDGSPSEGFTEIDDLEDDMEDRLSCVSNSNPIDVTVETPPSLPPQVVQMENTAAMESWTSKSQIHHGITVQNITGSQRPLLPFSARSVSIPSYPASISQCSTTDVVISSTFSLQESAFLRLGLPVAAAREAARWAKLIEGPSDQKSFHDVHVTCRRAFTQLTVTVSSDDLDPHPDFVSALERAVAYSTLGERARALRKALRSWGALIPTIIELGCALVATTSLSESNFDQKGDVNDSRRQHHAEEKIRVALGFKIDPPSYMAHEDKIILEPLARRMIFKAVGGNIDMQLSLSPNGASMRESKNWTIIGVDGVHSTLELLRDSHDSLYTKCQEVVAYIIAEMEAAIPPPTLAPPPILTFPGRLSAFRYDQEDNGHQAGFVNLDLPQFNIANPFTLSGWILNGRQIGINAALTIECVEAPYSLVKVGGWNKSCEWKAYRLTQPVEKPAISWLKSECKIKHNEWQHVTFVQTHNKMLLYVDGILVAHAAALVQTLQATRLRLCIGHATHGGHVRDQWDGCIENVNVWDRALSSTEVLQQADMQHRPSPGGHSALRYP